MNYQDSFIVHTPTEELCHEVQERLFSEGVPWVNDSFRIANTPWDEYGNAACIRFVPDTAAVRSVVGKLRCGNLAFYRVDLSEIPIISAVEFLYNGTQAMMLTPGRT